MKAFQISAAKHINRAATKPGERRRRGRVFTDRYHAELIKTPQQAHRAVGYVLNNWRKHSEDRSCETQDWLIDRYSTAILFDGWKERAGIPWVVPEGYEPLAVSKPQTWLLRRGWRTIAPISMFDVPSAAAAK